MTKKQKLAASVIRSKYISYRRDLINCWRDYIFTQFLVERYREEVYKDKSITLEIENYGDGSVRVFRAKHIDGFCQRIYENTNARRTLISSVSLTENYLQDVTTTLYKTYPERVNTRDSIETTGQQLKLMQVIFDSRSKTEMINKIIEEKVRGIFYGNPIDFFEKDKAKFGFGNTFKDKYPSALIQYAEIINRRNINVHNEGKVDRKYIRETGSMLKLGSKPKIDKTYLKSSVILLLDISSISTKFVLEKALSATHLNRHIVSGFKRFDNIYK